jgi:predicted DNA binding CopG/RHH family protein
LDRNPVSHSRSGKRSYAALAYRPSINLDKTNILWLKLVYEDLRVYLESGSRKTTIPAVEEPMNQSKIPQTDSIQELAKFWDTHDLTDFEEELEEVTEPVFDPETVVPIRLEAKEIAALKKLAKTKGIEYKDLIKEWVIEKLCTA